MIDSGANGNYVSEWFAARNNLPVRTKKEPYDLIAINGSSLPSENGGVDKETLPLPVAIKPHHEEITFDVLSMARHDVVLGIAWLEKHNPSVNWNKRTITFPRCNSEISIWPTRRQRSPVDERHYLNSAEIREVSTSIKEQSSSDSADIAQGRAGRQARVQEGSHDTFALPRKHERWRKLFQEELSAAALPQHKPWDHEIRLEPGKQLTFGPLYPMSAKELETLREYLDKNEKKGFIRKSQSPAGYPVLFVPKKDENLRFCVDYRKLNDITVKNRYPLPNISELQDRLEGAKWFTSLDLRGAYNLIRMKEGEEWKTAFRTRYGLYEYLIMPFGLTNAPASCQKLINDTLRECLDIYAIAYLDDILIYDKTMKEHERHVDRVLELLDSRNLRLNPDKCKFYMHEVDFLGFTVERTGTRIAEDKIQAVKEWPTPRTVKKLQAFIGFVNYLRKFIYGFSDIAAPLFRLLKQGTEFEWRKEQEEAMERLKQACITGPVQRFFDPTQPIQIETDASDLAIAACLSQMFEGNRHPVAYFARKLSSAEQNYEIHDKELLAIVASLQQWRVYAEGAPGLTVLTDHKNLLQFTTTKQLNRRQVRWAELLGQYKFVIRYTPGKDNGKADALSRRADFMDEKHIVNHSILKENKDGTLSPNTKEINATLRIIRDDKEQYPIIKGKLLISEEQLEDCIRNHHNDELHGHPGVVKTVEMIERNCTARGLREKVKDYIKRCTQCQKSKHSTHAKYGELQAAAVVEEPWSEVTMDFIVKLSPSPDSATGLVYDSIFVVVDRLTKYAHYIAFREDYDAVQLAYIFMDRIVRYHGVPRGITSDRDKLFVSQYWKTLVARIGVKLKLSTAFHPETDGQTERMNRTLEQYLRGFVNTEQNNWATLLPTAQLTLNNAMSQTTGLTPFFANFGRHPNMFDRQVKGHPNAEKGIIDAEAHRKVLQLSKERIADANERMTTRENEKRKMAPQLKEGDKVYLLTKNLKTMRNSRKLDDVKVGPFKVKEQKGPVNFELELPKGAKVHPVFHVSLLEPAHPDTPLQKTLRLEPDGDKLYEIEGLLKYDGQRYLVKWKSYPHSENTWEPKKNLTHFQQLTQDFHRRKTPSRNNPSRIATGSRAPGRKDWQ